jgi:hypothetical protein
MTRFTAFHPAPVLVVLDRRVASTGALSTAAAQRNPAKLGTRTETPQVIRDFLSRSAISTDIADDSVNSYVLIVQILLR